jgi:hypothetical protein
MALDLPAARQYNRDRHYSTNAIQIIQRTVGAAPTGSFDDSTVQRIFDWEGQPARVSRLSQDGKMGPLALGTMIAELSRAGNNADALVLSAFPNILPDGVAPPPGAVIRPVIEFRHHTVTPTGLRASGPGNLGFFFGGRFRVRLRLNPNADCRRFEYRQFIRGTCTARRGTFAAGLPRVLANWSPSGPESDRSSVFQVPGGLSATQLREDGQVVGGVTRRIGHRGAAQTLQEGLEDRYLPTRATGCDFHAVDTYGLRDNIRIIGTRLRLHLVFEGRVIDTSDHNRIIQRIHWSVRGDDIITS